MAEPNPHPIFDEAAIAAVIDQAAHQLAAVAKSQNITVLIAWPKRPGEIASSPSGWCELGRIADSSGRFWWAVLWHPERGEGRLRRELKRAKWTAPRTILQTG
jgi:hypothetical protein